ncbi:MAG: hypothetical protein IKA71_09010 [Lentisphaeria bacterium]|nr:hypothetical protein [Lentisphaeria bacterium]
MKKMSLLLLPLLLFCGCHSDQYYQNEAVERARRFLLENSTDLTSEQINFVRFNTPILLHAPVLSKKVSSDIVKIPVELHQICVSWMIPGKEETYMVFGVSTPRMRDWQPERIIRKSIEKEVAVMPSAAGRCISYARNNFFEELTLEEYNMLRYTKPYLYSTDFDLNVDPTGQIPEAELIGLRKGVAAKRQYSVVWKLPKRNLVFSGWGYDNFANWDIAMVGFMDDAEFSKHALLELMMPDDFYKSFPAEKEMPLQAESISNHNAENILESDDESASAANESAPVANGSASAVKEGVPVVNESAPEQKEKQEMK